MTKDEFVKFQNLLGFSNKELAEELKAAASSVSQWASGSRPIPAYIASALETLVQRHAGDMPLPLSLNEIIQLQKAADAQGLTIAEYIVQVLKANVWIPSTAIRDADETLVDLREQGF